ncbi:LOW QUALITY PROTEIN: hypothetical protein HID58_066451 [Brassica napus]|uniref:Uncharacterized protein n=1 Tax=Brassica napus TaxID=3708 RepID=A0ABQ7ZFN7_BRANA|nr:LOW QUALITY PROTEIN: hypothetical protein HID58_066451 [Brassica napus]
MSKPAILTPCSPYCLLLFTYCFVCSDSVALAPLIAKVSPVTDSVDRTGSGVDLLSSPPGDSSGNDSGGENYAVGEPIEGNQGIEGATLLTEDSLKHMRRKCGFSREIETRLLSNEKRPWSAPPGWIFSSIADMVSSSSACDVAISQMSPSTIRNMVISLVLGAEVDVDVDAEFFEMIYQMNLITGKTLSVSIKTRCRLMEGRGLSKADGWQRKYFFVRVSPASVADSSAVFRTEWNPEPVPRGKFRLLPSWATDRLNHILRPGRIAWIDFTVERVRRSIPRITTASRVVTSGPSTVAEPSKTRGGASAGKKMGKVKRDIPVYTKAMSETPSVLPSASLKESGSSSALVPAPVVIPPTDPNADPSVAAIHSSLDETTGGGDHLSMVGLSDPDAPTVSPPAAPSLLGALIVRGLGAASSSERPPSGGSKKRKRTFVFEDPDSSLLTPEDCAWYLHSFRLSSIFLPDLEDMSFVQEYVEWASCEAQENSIKLEAESRDLRAEVGRLKGDITERDYREKKLLSQKLVLEAEVAHLKESRAELAESERRRVESAMLARFGEFVEKVRKYLSYRDVVRPQILIESQLSRVVSCLKLFIKEGIPIPAPKLAENEQALVVHTAALNQMEVDDLEISDLPSFSFDADSLCPSFALEVSLVFVRVRSRLRCRVGVFRPFAESVSSLGGGRDSARLIPCKDRDKCMSKAPYGLSDHRPVRVWPWLCCRVGVFRPFAESVSSLGGGRDSARLIPCKLDTAYPITDPCESGLGFAVGSGFLGPSPRAFLLWAEGGTHPGLSPVR